MAQETRELAEAIVEWASKRATWEKQALALMTSAQPLTDDVVTGLADIAEQEAQGSPVPVSTLAVEDFAVTDGGNLPVRISSISSPRSVNALNWDEGLTFAPTGVTLVYGENGSGKSGYARILKKVTRARSDAEVLSNVFETPGSQSAVLSVTEGDAEPADLQWPAESPGFLSRVSFYDSDCSTRYISTDTEVALSPERDCATRQLGFLGGTRPQGTGAAADGPIGSATKTAGSAGGY